jgi:hypothetical protein
MTAPDSSQWRMVEFRLPVVGSPSFFDPSPRRFDLSQAFEAEVLLLRGKVRGPNAHHDYEVLIYDEHHRAATVFLTAHSVMQIDLPIAEPDKRAVFMAASVLRSPDAAHYERLLALETSARHLLPLMLRAKETHHG